MKTRFCVSVICLMMTGLSCTLERELSAFMENPDIHTPDLSRVEDGIYRGQQKAGPINVRVEVTVADHRMTACRILRHRSGRGKPANTIADSILKAQTLNVDVISGATLSSTVIKKAVQLALESDPVSPSHPL